LNKTKLLHRDSTSAFEGSCHFYLTKKLKTCQCAWLFKAKTTSWPECTTFINQMVPIGFLHTHASSRTAYIFSNNNHEPRKVEFVRIIHYVPAARNPKCECVLHNAGNFDAQALKLIKAVRRGQRNAIGTILSRNGNLFMGRRANERAGVICGRQGRQLTYYRLHAPDRWIYIWTLVLFTIRERLSKSAHRAAAATKSAASKAYHLHGNHDTPFSTLVWFTDSNSRRSRSHSLSAAAATEKCK